MARPMKGIAKAARRARDSDWAMGGDDGDDELGYAGGGGGDFAMGPQVCGTGWK